MLTKESYEEVKARAEELGLSFWELTAKALQYYIRKKTGIKITLKITNRQELVAERTKHWAEVEYAIMEELARIRPKGLSFSQISRVLVEWKLPTGRTALQARLDSLTSQKVLRKIRVGVLFGKPINQWSCSADEDLVNDWFDRAVLGKEK